jgi:phosphotransferase system enzyme I (PtsI)
VKATGRRKGLEAVLPGIGVSPGVAVGPVFLAVPEEDHFVERRIGPEEAFRETSRLEGAVIETRRQINALQENVRQAVGGAGADIFDVHKMVLDDQAFADEVIRQIRHERHNAEAAVRLVAERYAAGLAQVNDEYLRERVADVKDVARRVMRNLCGCEGSVLGNLKTKSVVVAADLAPSETAALRKDLVVGFATDQGSATSHTAIMARALGIPAVVGLRDVTVRVAAGERVLIDGTEGVLVVRPTLRRLRQYGKRAEARRTIVSGLSHLRDAPAETKDGHRVTLSANVELLGELPEVRKCGATGIGLFRSEYLYISRSDLPTEDEQYAAYREAAERLAPDPVIIRTVDLGGDKFVSAVQVAPEINPFLGFRAIRFCLAHPDIFKVQLRAILRASAHGTVRLMYPMVSTVEEVVRANALVEECRKDLRERRVPFDEAIAIGAMIEIPSAALTAGILARHVDFFSLGTNDLIQYTLAVDRVNDRVTHLYEPTHPAVLKLLKATIDAGHARGIWVGICGEMAGDPRLSPLLLGLGMDELSMVPSSVPAVKDAIRAVTLAQARELAERALASDSASAVMEHCRTLTAQAAPEILELVR